MPAVALFCERARAHDPGFRPRRRQRRRGRGDLPATSTGCRWRSSWRPPAAGLLSPGEIAERLNTALGALAQRRSRRARAPADAARDDRLEPRAAQRRREGVLRTIRRVRRRRDGRSGRDDHRRRPRHARSAGRQEPARDAASTAAPRPGWRCSKRSAPTPPSASRPPPTRTPSASATTATFSRSPSATEATARFGAPAARSTWPCWTRRSTTFTRPLLGRSGRTAPSRPSRCASRPVGTG